MIHLCKRASQFLEGRTKSRKPLTKVKNPQGGLLVTLFRYNLTSGETAWEYVQDFTPFRLGLKTSTGQDFKHDDHKFT